MTAEPIEAEINAAARIIGDISTGIYRSPANALRVSQVLRNLIACAAPNSPRPHRTRLSAHRYGRLVEISVETADPGTPESTAPYGSGNGASLKRLDLCRGIVAAHGGG